MSIISELRSRRRTDDLYTDFVLQMIGDEIRYVSEWRKWLRWNGTNWRVVPTENIGMLLRIVHDGIVGIVRNEIGWPAALDPDDDPLVSFIAKYGNKSARANIENLLTKMVSVSVDQLDSDENLLGTDNGVINLTHRESDEEVALGADPHDVLHERTNREALVTKSVRLKFKPREAAPNWEKFLATVLPDDEVRSFVQRFAGYSLTGATSEQCILYLYGTGANGKSVFLQVLKEALGEYAVAAQPGLLSDRPNQNRDYQLAQLHGRRLVIVPEVSRNDRLDDAFVKQLTGGETLSARAPYGQIFEFTPQCKLLIAANYLMDTQGGDSGIWRRLHLVEFPVTIPEEDRDIHLIDKLRKELPQILNWMLEGYFQYDLQGLAPPNSVRHDGAEWREANDPFTRWRRLHTEVGPDAWTSKRDLYNSYVQFCQAVQSRPDTIQMMGKRLREDKSLEDKKQDNIRGFAGIKLLSAWEAAARMGSDDSE